MSGILSKLSSSMPWLDSSAQKLHQVTEPLLGEHRPAALKDALYGTWLGHPLHPVMTDIPIGGWTTSVVLDIFGMEKGSDIALKFGTIGAVGAAVTGAAQWFDLQNEEEPRRLGSLHAMLNSAALGFYVASWVLRDRGHRGPGIATAWTGYTIASTSAWVGGHLSYALGIGVSRDAFENAPMEWTDAIGESELIDGQMKRTGVGGSAILLLKQGDHLYATSAVCTHVGGPLDEGDLNGTCVTCPWHGSEFDLRDGKVLHGPATTPVHAFETRVTDGTVQIRVLAG